MLPARLRFLHLHLREILCLTCPYENESNNELIFQHFSLSDFQHFHKVAQFVRQLLFSPDFTKTHGKERFASTIGFWIFDFGFLTHEH